MIDSSGPDVNNLDSHLLAVLSQAEEELSRFVNRKAGRLLLNYESGSDLVQGFLLDALSQAKNFPTTMTRRPGRGSSQWPVVISRTAGRTGDR